MTLLSIRPDDRSPNLQKLARVDHAETDGLLPDGKLRKPEVIVKTTTTLAHSTDG